MAIGDIYFFTATLHRWIPLLAGVTYKEIVLSSLRNLTDRKLLNVFAFVRMPNPIHLIWRTSGLNGKETVQASFLKFTAHAFQKQLQEEGDQALFPYRVDAQNKKFEFWQRDSLAVPLFTRAVAFQKLHYIHQNPLAAHWNLATDPNDYPWSSCSFYERGISEYSFLKDLRVEFDG